MLPMNISDDFNCPDVIRGECNVLKHQVADFLLDNKKSYSDVIPFLAMEKKHLDSAKSKIGKDAEAYIMMSTLVINACLVKIIPAINAEQERLDYMGIQYGPLHYDEFRKLKDIAATSWKAYSILDRMAMEYQFKEEQYLPSKATLKKICDGMGLDTRSTQDKISDHIVDSIDDGCLKTIIELIVASALFFVIALIVSSNAKACS